MAEVSAMTYPDEERDVPAQKITGILTKRDVDSLDYVQFLIDGVPVDPDTIEDVTDNSFFSRKKAVEEQSRAADGRWSKTGSVKESIAKLKGKHPEVAAKYEDDSGTEMGSIDEHTHDVGRVWPTQISHEELHAISDRWGSDIGKLMHDAIALHDIGKGGAIAEGSKSLQHEYTAPIMRDILTKEGYSKKDVSLAVELFNHDYLGLLAQGGGHPETLAKKIREKAQSVGMMAPDFAKLQLAFYHSDAGAYPYVRDNFMEKDSKGRLLLRKKRLAKIEDIAAEPVENRGNPNHDHLGRFASGSGIDGASGKTEDIEKGSADPSSKSASSDTARAATEEEHRVLDRADKAHPLLDATHPHQQELVDQAASHGQAISSILAHEPMDHESLKSITGSWEKSASKVPPLEKQQLSRIIADIAQAKNPQEHKSVFKQLIHGLGRMTKSAFTATAGAIGGFAKDQLRNAKNAAASVAGSALHSTGVLAKGVGVYTAGVLAAGAIVAGAVALPAGLAAAGTIGIEAAIGGGLVTSLVGAVAAHKVLGLGAAKAGEIVGKGFGAIPQSAHSTRHGIFNVGAHASNSDLHIDWLEVEDMVANSEDEVELLQNRFWGGRGNPYHDHSNGQFTSSDGGTSKSSQISEGRRIPRLPNGDTDIHDPQIAPQFKSWFRHSKVVDKNGDPTKTAEADIDFGPSGEPIPVFHGTPRGEFEEFRKDKLGNPESEHFGPGFYFTEDIKAAESFAHSLHGAAENPVVMKLYLSIKRPFDVDHDTIHSSKLSSEYQNSVKAQVVQRAYSEDGRDAALEAKIDFEKDGVELSYYDMVAVSASKHPSFGLSKEYVKSLLETRGYDGMTVSSATVRDGDVKKSRYWIAFEPTQIKSTKAIKFDESDPIITHSNPIQNLLTKNQLDILDELVENRFCATGKGGGRDPSCDKDGNRIGTSTEAGVQKTAGIVDAYTQRKGQLEEAAARQLFKFLEESIGSEQVTTVSRKRVYSPNVEKTDRDGVTEAARVGVPAKVVPPPPEVGQLPNLTPHERYAETSFRKAFHADPEKLTNQYGALVEESTKEGDPLVFNTDDAKALHPAWNGSDLAARSQNRATLNNALHGTANAIAKRAFVKALDHLSPGDELLVTVGGCGAGKGYALKNVPQALALKKQAKVVWDSAGDQNATENPWIQQEAKKRGLKVNYLFVHADPYRQWSDPDMGVVKRAGDQNDGRMVDAKVFADSYGIGAKNHQAFFEANKHNPNANFMFLTGRGKSGKPEEILGVPEEALRIDRHDLANYAIKTVMESSAPAHIKRGATTGVRIWKEESK